MTPPDAPKQPLRIALLGLGTVGAAVCRLLVEESGERTAGLRLVAVADRDDARLGAVEAGDAERVADGAWLVERSDVDAVVELVGGVDAAGRLVRAALRSGKHVVTANKALLARQGAELEALARDSGVALRFEAAVGGGTPVLSPLASDLAANRVRRVRGIVNGSTNYILTAMSEGGGEYEAALRRAQELGYAEADPGTDVEGRDAADKLAVLVRLAFGAWPDVAGIRRVPPGSEGDGMPGITGVSARVIEAAARNGLRMRLVASAERGEDGRVRAAVLPCAVPVESALGRTAGVENRIEIDADPVGRVAFVGPGAGGASTSSAVVGDLLAVAAGRGSTWGPLPPAGPLSDGLLVDGLDVPRRWLVPDPSIEGEVTGPVALEALRGRLPAHRSATLYPILDEA